MEKAYRAFVIIIVIFVAAIFVFMTRAFVTEILLDLIL